MTVLPDVLIFAWRTQAEDGVGAVAGEWCVMQSCRDRDGSIDEDEVIVRGLERDQAEDVAEACRHAWREGWSGAMIAMEHAIATVPEQAPEVIT